MNRNDGEKASDTDSPDDFSRGMYNAVLLGEADEANIPVQLPESFRSQIHSMAVERFSIISFEPFF